MSWPSSATAAPSRSTSCPGHPCWRAQKALDEAGVGYEVVMQPAVRRNRKEIERRTGQRALPVLELEDGTMLREESADLDRRMSRAG